MLDNDPSALNAGYGCRAKLYQKLSPITTPSCVACPSLLILTCLSQEHSSGVYGLQIDDFQIVSGSNDDTILIWDFLDPVPPGDMQTDQSKDKKDLT